MALPSGLHLNRVTASADAVGLAGEGARLAAVGGHHPEAGLAGIRRGRG